MDYSQDALKGVEFKPCPFCGTEPSAYIEDDDQRNLILHISCGKCNAEMTGYLASGSREPLNQDRKKALIEQWNSRV